MVSILPDSSVASGANRAASSALSPRSERLGPVHGQIHVAATVIKLTDLTQRRLAFGQDLTRRDIQSGGQDAGGGIAGFVGQVLNADR